MSTRLKRKLGDLGVDTSSAKANESFCLIGTPLPPLEKSKDLGEFVPLWKQDVRDEQGRRRLHGAFTGGFSAGYFNTVGSKEGWTPTAFVSSRGERAKQKSARPEDFMDEEDLAELKEGQTLIDTTEEMDFTGGTQVEMARRGDESEKDSITLALQASMLPTPKDSVGARILKKMGWKMGQGIGPRLSWRQRKVQDAGVLGGVAMGMGNGAEEEYEEEASKHTYARRDTPVIVVERKDNSHGLGYRPEMGLNESLGVKNGGPSGPKLSAGFGLGALNDADEDDLDVYDGGFNSSRNRIAYDIADRAEDDRIAIGNKGNRSQPLSSSCSTQKFRDGTTVLAGFVLAERPVADDRWFPLPDVPKGWRPDPRRVWQLDKENAQGAKPSTSEAVPHSKWKAGISADERGAILGETPLPAVTRSVFEYMSQKDRERLQNIASSTPTNSVEPAPHTTNPTANTFATTITIPHTEPHIAQAALRGFQPFTLDPVKQSRYTAYIQSQASLGASAPPPRLPDQKIDEYNKELTDYAKAATIFKPVSGAMAGRFTSAAVIEHGPKIHEGLHTPSAADFAAEREALEETEKEQKREEAPKVHAARMGMYGPLTREARSWQPVKILCKRFGVKDPNPEPDVEAEAKVQKGGGADTFDESMGATQGSGDIPPPQAASSSSRSGRRDLANIGLGDDEDQGRDTLTYQRPAMDIFKAIFASDDEDSGEEDVKEESDDEPQRPVVMASSSSAPPLSEKTKKDPEAIPTSAPAGPTGHQPVDIGTFKPTFIPREGKSKHESSKEKSKKDKKKKSGKSGKVLVSFEVEEDGAGAPISAPEKLHKKKKRREKKEGDDDDGMWVEKPPPEVVKNISVTKPPERASDTPLAGKDVVAGPPKGRKRAIDFM